MADNAFDEILDVLTDEADKKAWQELGTKYKPIKEYGLRQSDYSRKMNDLSSERKKFDDERKRIEGELSQLESWRNWRSEHWLDLDDGEGITKEHQEDRKKIEELNQELQILREAQESGMTFDEVQQFIDKDLTKRGYISKKDLEDRFSNVVTRDFYDKDIVAKTAPMFDAMGKLYEDTLPLGFSHKEEFGEVFKIGELIKFANENGIKDITKAYDSWVAPRRSEVQKKKTEELLTKAREEGKAEGLKEAGMGQNGRLPVDNKPPVMSHLEARLKLPKDQQEANPVPEDVELGKGVSGFIAQQYRKDVAEGNVLK